MRTWSPGDIIAFREISWGRPVLAWPVFVVFDTPEILGLFTPMHAPFSFSDESYPGDTGRHPWWPGTRWEGHGVLMLQRPGDAYAVWHFWRGENREFDCWYLNLQDPLRRTTIGVDTDDHELDIVISPNGTWHFKDAALLEERIHEGRYSSEQGDLIKAQGTSLASMIESGDVWWDTKWAHWSPPADWVTPSPLPDDWIEIPWD